MEYYLVLMKKEILTFAMIWIKLEDIMLSEMTEAQTDKYHIISLR
jgi:hypothetical protein